MDSVRSPLSYGKVDELEDRAFQRKTFKRLIIIVASTVVLLSLIVCAVAGLMHYNRNAASKSPPQAAAAAASMLEKLCNVTRYPDSCYSSLSSYDTGDEKVNSIDPAFVFNLSLRVAKDAHLRLSSLPTRLLPVTDDERFKAALRACEELIDDAIDNLSDTIEYFHEVGKGERGLSKSEIDDMRTMLSTVIADQVTCFDGFEDIRDLNSTAYELNSKLIKQMKSSMQNASEFASNSLAIVTIILGSLAKYDHESGNRRLLAIQETNLRFPGWLGTGERRFLLYADPIPNVTVAKDGSGNFKTIKEAVAAVPDKAKSRFVIHVKEGVYVENVILDKNKWNVMIYGDGNRKTVVSGSLNVARNLTKTTYQTATFSAEGKGFIARDIKFVNTAGPEGGQAVAFHSKSDYSVLYRCAFEGFQDTLYPHAKRQFYRDCDIVGTVDFICGHAAAVFQNCSVKPRQPKEKKYVTITAQAKSDSRELSGFSFQKCTISPLEGVDFTAATYLGRPWKEYSTTVILESYIGSIVSPLGWIAWNASLGPPKTLFYGEYKNFGPGAGLIDRVKWTGYKPNMTDADADKFTVGIFIEGSKWLPATGVPFQASL